MVAVIIPATIIGIISCFLGALGIRSLTNQSYDAKVVSASLADEYLGINATWSEKLQCVMLDRIASARLEKQNTTYSIVVQEQNGLWKTQDAKGESNIVTKPPPLIIGTIRMGYGHYRIAHSVASFADNLPDGRKAYFHDIVEIGNQEAAIPQDAEAMYSTASRMLTETPHWIEPILSKITSGGPDATTPLRLQLHAATLMQNLMGNLDRDSPVIATHPLVAAIAVAANFTNVINLVVDNHPQWFVVVPKALNLIQGPKLYRELMKLGSDNVELAGHWNPRCIVDQIPEATERRIARAKAGKPLRLLIPVGGAGAQESFLVDLVGELADSVRNGKVQLLLNAGDHKHMDGAFRSKLQDLGLKFSDITTSNQLDQFESSLRRDEELSSNVVLFAYDNIHLAVTTTDRMASYCDVLVCKPSEMAFYAVPKIMIRRVGDHEEKSAIRAAEMGEGTLEARTIPEILKEVDTMLSKPEDLIMMNHMILKNNEIRLYSGVEYAVQRAMRMVHSN